MTTTIRQRTVIKLSGAIFRDMLNNPEHFLRKEQAVIQAPTGSVTRAMAVTAVSAARKYFDTLMDEAPF